MAAEPKWPFFQATGFQNIHLLLLPVCLCVFLPAHVCLSVSLLASLCKGEPSVSVSVSLSICLCTHFPASFPAFLPAFLPVCYSACVSACRFACLPLSRCVCLLFCLPARVSHTHRHTRSLSECETACGQLLLFSAQPSDKSLKASYSSLTVETQLRNMQPCKKKGKRSGADGGFSVCGGAEGVD